MMKRILIILLSMMVAASVFATTKTVSQSGTADFQSIQAAIDSLTQAQVTDGQPDEVVILDGAEYDEQVSVGGMVEVTDSTGPGYLDAAVALAQQRDPFTLRGADAANRPQVNPINVTPRTYGVFNDDPTDNFTAALTYWGKQLTFENIEFYGNGSFTDKDGDGQYVANGQAGQATFRNVMFAHFGELDPGEDFFAINNNAALAGLGFNSYTFENCTFDGMVRGQRADNAGLYFHGISNGDATDAGLDPSQVAMSLQFINCKMMNFDTALRIRNREQAENHVVIQNCFVSGNHHGARIAGHGVSEIQNNIFQANAGVAGDFSSDSGAVETEGRNGFTPELNITNNLFVDNLNKEEFQGAIGGTSRAATILIRNDGTNNSINVNNNTFVGNPLAIRFSDSAGREHNGVVNNNIFQGCSVAVLTADDSSGSYFTSPNADAAGVVSTLTVQGTGNVFDNNNVVVEDANLLPNVNIGGSTAAVTFSNPTLNTADPFSGPPYDTGLAEGAHLGAPASVDAYMLY